MRLPQVFAAVVLPVALMGAVVTASPTVASEQHQTVSTSNTSTPDPSVADFVKSLQAAKDPNDKRYVMLSGINDTNSEIRLSVSGMSDKNDQVTPLIHVTVKPGESGKIEALRSMFKARPILSLTVCVHDTVLRLPVTGTEFKSIDVGGELRPGDSVRSTDGRSVAKLTQEGSDAVLSTSRGGKSVARVFSAPIADAKNLHLTLDNQGKLMLHGAPWTSGPNGRADDASGRLVAEVANDGNFVLTGAKNHQIYWINGMNVDMRNGEKLHLGQALSSPDGNYQLSVDTLSGFVLRKDGCAVWGGGGWFRTGVFEGNELKGIDRHGQCQWMSFTNRLVTDKTGDLFLRVANEGRVEIVGSKNGQVVWANGSPITPQTITRLDPGQTMVNQTALVSPNGKSELRNEFFETAVYSGGKKAWALAHYANHKYVTMTDNNLIVKYIGLDIVLYSSDTAKFVTPETGDLYLRINDAGKLQFVGTLNGAVVHTI